MRPRVKAADHEDIFVSHGIEELTVDLGEIRMNYATRGDPSLPALLMVPAAVGAGEGHVPSSQGTLLICNRTRNFDRNQAQFHSSTV